MKLRHALFGLICMAGALTACGESPTAPADVPLAGAESLWNNNTVPTTDTTQVKNDKDGPTESTRGYILGM